MLNFEDGNVVVKVSDYLKQNRSEGENLFDYRLHKLYITYGSMEMKDRNFELVKYMDENMKLINGNPDETDFNVTLDALCLNPNFENGKFEVSSQHIKREFSQGYVIYTFVMGYVDTLLDFAQKK